MFYNIVAFQTRKTPENTFILFIFHVRKRGGKKMKFTAKAAFRKNLKTF